MPNLDGTGPTGEGPLTGRRLGFLPRFRGRRQGGTKQCKCPNCGYTQPHRRGTPCTELICPKCNTPLKGVFCL
ncbi:DUF5320 family protein [Candidatus Dojkabacteria bacterium]|uniref:DUF5320 family protein n=1 Tax=Candidatus Dojkabacteria bacterium TaxID=2099670 RepID=A0A847VCG7_9BACT|nr:DUF5320 family protein [Candidatus Dojkabacteria bacterium]